MPHQVTLSGKTGPNKQMVGTVLSDVTRLIFDFNDKRIQVYRHNNARELELDSAATITFTNSGGNFSVTIS